ncbi:MAG: sugar kinase [Betaproteobacteria bacterium]|nr:sugar kinase [Betaproteobacteria bacterium]
MSKSTPAPRFDFVGLGESMLRLSVPSGQRLDDTRSLDMELGGAESNVGVALARLGWRTGWVSRMPDHALANAVLRALRADGVDVSAVKCVPGERLGTYFIEYAAAPRSTQVIYDRADSAASHMRVDDIDWAYLLDTRVLHLTGITAALSDACYAVLLEAIKRAHAAGVTVSFDVNYRAKLWTAATAGEKLRPLIAAADILFCKGADARVLFGCQGEARQLMQELQALTRAPAIFCTFGEQGAALLSGKEFVAQPALPVQIVDRIGSGDCFAAGVLDGWLSGAACVDGTCVGDTSALREGLRRGVGLAAIALTQFGDRILTSRAELNAVLGSDRHDISR